MLVRPSASDTDKGRPRPSLFELPTLPPGQLPPPSDRCVVPGQCQCHRVWVCTGTV